MLLKIALWIVGMGPHEELEVTKKKLGGKKNNHTYNRATYCIFWFNLVSNRTSLHPV